MKNLTIKSKNYGTQVITDVENFAAETASKNSTVFLIVKHIFNEWYNYNTQPGAPMAKEIPGMYFGECDQPAIYTVTGAIYGGIQNLIEIALEEGKSFLTTKDIMKMDIECAFE